MEPFRVHRLVRSTKSAHLHFVASDIVASHAKVITNKLQSLPLSEFGKERKVDEAPDFLL